MAQPSSTSIKQQLIKASEDLKEDARKNAKHIEYESFGTDKNKKRKNQKSCDRGTSSGPARYCSGHLRQIYNQNIIGDNGAGQWCVGGRHAAQCCINVNPCHLCNINTQHYIKTRMVNFGEAINHHLGGNNDNTDAEKYNRRLLSFMISHIGSNYPGTGNEQSVLRIKCNGQKWVEYYIKLTAFSSLLKTSAPSGYKYKDRISLGRMIRIGPATHNDLIFYVTKDPRYNDPQYEAERPVVNGVGFWGLLKEPKDGDIRNIIHLNNDQAVNVSFGFLINKCQNNVKSIKVELVCTRHSLGMDNTVLPLWSYPEIEEEIKSNPPMMPPTMPPTMPAQTHYMSAQTHYMPAQTHYMSMNNDRSFGAQGIKYYEHRPMAYQYQPFNIPFNPSYSASHGVSNNVEQFRHSPLHSNVSVSPSYPVTPNGQVSFEDEYKMEGTVLNQNYSSPPNTNMSFDGNMFDDNLTVNGINLNPNMMVFDDNITVNENIF